MVRKRSNSWLSPVLALVIAGGAGMFFMSMVNSNDTKAVVKVPPPIIKDAPTVQILTANSDISIGQRVSQRDLTWRAWPESLLNAEYITKDENPRKIKELIGGIAKLPLVYGEPIVNGKIILPGTRGAMAVLIRKGMRAISVAISATTSAGGFILPGDYVDVILTTNVVTENLIRDEIIASVSQGRQTTIKRAPLKNYLELKSMALQSRKENQPSENDNKSNILDKKENKNDGSVLAANIKKEKELLVANNRQLTELFLENVRVLAIDQNASSSNKNQKGNQAATMVGGTATLEVTPEQAKLLAWAASTGQLTLSLRSLSESFAEDNKEGEQKQAMDSVPVIKTGFAWPVKDLLEYAGKLPVEEENNNNSGGVQLIRSGRVSVLNNVVTNRDKEENTRLETSAGNVNVQR